MDAIDRLIDEAGLSDVRQLLREFTVPAVRLSLVDEGASPLESQTGGVPLLPKGTPWPCETVPSDKEKTRLETAQESFLKHFQRFIPDRMPALSKEPRKLDVAVQIKLAELRDFPAAAVLPKDGILTFFLACNPGWGFSVIHTPEGAETAPIDEPTESRFTQLRIRFLPIETVPYPGTRTFLKLSEGAKIEWEKYVALLQSIERHAGTAQIRDHQLLGNYCPTNQRDNEMTAELESRGITYGEFQQRPKLEQEDLEASAAEWILLLQLRADPALGLMPRTTGSVFYWIKGEDLEARRFDRVWATLERD